MLELRAKLLNTYYKPAVKNDKYTAEESYKLQVIWDVPQQGGDVKMVTQDLTITEEGFKLCTGRMGQELRIPVEVSAKDGKLLMWAPKGVMPQFIKSAPAPSAP
jgi:hypothetical protein